MENTEISCFGSVSVTSRKGQIFRFTTMTEVRHYDAHGFKAFSTATKVRLIGYRRGYNSRNCRYWPRWEVRIYNGSRSFRSAMEIRPDCAT